MLDLRTKPYILISMFYPGAQKHVGNLFLLNETKKQ